MSWAMSFAHLHEHFFADIETRILTGDSSVPYWQIPPQSKTRPSDVNLGLHLKWSYSKVASIPRWSLTKIRLYNVHEFVRHITLIVIHSWPDGMSHPQFLHVYSPIKSTRHSYSWAGPLQYNLFNKTRMSESLIFLQFRPDFDEVFARGQVMGPG